jgi:hypothetical protein
MHGPINVKSPNNTSKWQMRFNSAFKGLVTCTQPIVQFCSILFQWNCYTTVFDYVLHYRWLCFTLSLIMFHIIVDYVSHYRWLCFTLSLIIFHIIVDYASHYRWLCFTLSLIMFHIIVYYVSHYRLLCFTLSLIMFHIIVDYVSHLSFQHVAIQAMLLGMKSLRPCKCVQNGFFFETEKM